MTTVWGELDTTNANVGGVQPSIRELYDGLKENLEEGYVVRNTLVDETRSNVFVDLFVEHRMSGIVKGVWNGGKRHDGPSVNDQQCHTLPYSGYGVARYISSSVPRKAPA